MMDRTKVRALQCVAVFLAAFTAAGTVVEENASWVSVVLLGEPTVASGNPLKPVESTIETVVFDGYPAEARITVGISERAAKLSKGGRGNPPWSPRSSDWDQAIDWNIRAADPTTAARFRPEALRITRRNSVPGVAPSVLLPAQSAKLHYNIEGLAPGAYLVSARVTLISADQSEVSAESSVRLLSVYRGDENDAIRKAALRARAKRATSEGDAKAQSIALLELARISPDDPAPYLSLADASVRYLSPDVTLSYYQAGLRIAERNVASQFGSHPPPSAHEALERIRRKVLEFERLTPYYRAHFEEIGLFVTNIAMEERFLFFRRSDGKVISQDKLPK